MYFSKYSLEFLIISSSFVTSTVSCFYYIFHNTTFFLFMVIERVCRKAFGSFGNPCLFLLRTLHISFAFFISLIL